MRRGSKFTRTPQRSELVAVFDGYGTGRFFGQPIRHIDTYRQVAFDLLLVATLERSAPIVELLVQPGIERERLVTLRPA